MRPKVLRRPDRSGSRAGAEWTAHVEVERAQAGPFGEPITHGRLPLSRVGPLFAALLTVRETTVVVNYGLDRVRFPAPVPAGNRAVWRIRCTATSLDHKGQTCRQPDRSRW
ncbi:MULTISPECIES: MaoC/PaaZ C-terminal domain-containing protein [Amycolatopsis]|uniref:MaoC/PaaZ C-terminal domain-containing protein n=1 Tax=Amycolatopsis TaxID=1813 RepID=UPI000B8ACAE0|nr:MULTISPECIES: MaoC/PaaZ C-terminal domain-containing protein [Amycolatopsis]OXM67193.1 hypothetical protein CF166_25020 [Amycolatopsis sp. KNN50.9b]